MSDSDSNPNFPFSAFHSDSDSDTNPQQHTIVAESSFSQLDNHHLSSINATISIRQLKSQGLSFQLWPAASSLVSLLNLNPSVLLTKPETTSPLRILEVGSGTGLVGIAAASLLGANVTITDLPHVVENLGFNAELNDEVVRSNGGSVCVKQLRWGDEGDAKDVLKDEESFDLVLGTDVVYYEELIEPLIKTLEVFVKGKTSFIMAHLRRWKKRDAIFFRKAGKKFSVEVLHKDPPLPEWRSGVTVYRFMAKKGK
ncbi:hypothetical protein LUZ60_005067 [Juncus effusus]|nr:hypothetical protein LUZ60_005067 [Juncus effusus]